MNREHMPGSGRDVQDPLKKVEISRQSCFVQQKSVHLQPARAGKPLVPPELWSSSYIERGKKETHNLGYHR